MESKVRIPLVKDIRNAVEIYWSNIELRSSDIRNLFGRISSKTVVSLKKLAKEKMEQKGTPSWNASRVNTKDAYEAWGLDIADLEKRYAKIQKLKGE